jgi:hypothetical protein
MLAPVQQHVDEAVAYLTWRPERAAMVAVRPDATPTVELAVDRLREPDAEPLHPTSERLRPLCLGEEMHVIGLDRKVHDAKGTSGHER